MFVYVVSLDIAYEGSDLLGVFSDYVKAREYQLSLCGGGSISSDYVIRKVELDFIYKGYEVGEEM
jgi:hypothetical protein